MNRVSLPAVLVAVALGASGVRTGAPPPLHVLVITLDTTRADRLSPYGFADVSLPHLERLAAEGVVFDRASSVAPLTLPAHTSLFTGLLPPHHGVRDNLDAPLGDDHTTLAEVLRARGYRTAAFVGSVVLDQERGLRQGFEEYGGVPPQGEADPPRRQRRAEKVVDDAVRWIESADGSPSFLWVHLYDPHLPYAPPQPYASLYAHNPYVGEIAYADSQIGRLLRALDDGHLLERTVVIVAGDHGESLGDHGEPAHGVFIYESVLRVPLIVRAPGISPARIGAVVRLTDVMPTVLDLLGLPALPVDGASLAGMLAGRVADLDLEAYSESMNPAHIGSTSRRALRERRFKLIDAPHPELYDLHRDPFERHNVYQERPATAAALTRRLRTVSQLDPADPELASEPSLVSRQLAEQLAALGYVGRRGEKPD